MEVEIRSRNGWLFAVVRKQRGLGRAVVRRLGTKSMTEARELVRHAGLEQMALAAKADAIGHDVWTRLLAGRRVRVRDGAERYEQHRYTLGFPAAGIANAMMMIDCWLRYTGLANEPVASITAQHVSDFVNQEGEAKLQTRKHRLGILNSFLKYLFDQRWIVRNPAIDVAVRIDGLTQEQLVAKPHEPFTSEEVQKLLAAIPRSDFWHGAVRIGNEFGLRLGDVATLEEGNVVANRMRIFTRKGRRVVDQPMSPETAQWFLEWREHRPFSDLPYVFPKQAAMASQRLSEQFTRLIARHGITGKSYHGLRKTATARVWNNALSDLGDRQAQALAKMVAEHGYRRVQELLAHAPGSDVTANHYFPRE